jgi:hypothetical protein
MGLPDLRKSICFGLFTGAGSGASGRSTESVTGAGWIDISEEVGVNGKGNSMDKEELTGEEFVG